MMKTNLNFGLLLFAVFCILYGLIISTKRAESLGSSLLFLFVAYISWQLSNFLWNKVTLIPKELVSPFGKAVMITGCDTGFGHILAKRLNKYGFYVYAGCLFPEGDGANQLRSECADNLHIVKLDVTKDDEIYKAAQEVKESIGDRKLWAVVNNAGILISAEIEMGDIQCFDTQMDVNCLGIVRVTKAFLPLLRKAKGRVVNMASLAGRYSIPGMVAYCMSKAAVISFSDGLRREMKKWDVDVITIEPHLFKTNLCDDKSQKSCLLNLWNRTPIDVRQEYGESYFAGFQTLLDHMLGSARSKITNVVDTMAIAVTHQSVSPNYLVLGDFERLRICIWNLLPVRVLDLISHLLCIRYTGKPVFQRSQKTSAKCK
ncbi:retinol dehydrogenase 3-like protein [Dinothrombium tinctorium]|uniref:Retinol dehydrogenase 3-like protein n=1 Tax=Dinothrombium tinctorium TaxID=1965070 RepID=A0A3S4RAE7_9ACAR|nr:retinol dehydrogenase 3-like protein [Dinothrombium tinctorium]RWS15245.1 retinol dehydrogenase 3-like protein [Dinothrombium tinctorium]RWS15532.1 retinol dehydrogenase 3-like protein [Dinothrombium tinctorium]